MQQTPHLAARDLRVAFDDAVISVSLAPGCTLAEVAQLWQDVVLARAGNPVDVKITFAARRDGGAPSTTAP